MIFKKKKQADQASSDAGRARVRYSERTRSADTRQVPRSFSYQGVRTQAPDAPVKPTKRRDRLRGVDSVALNTTRGQRLKATVQHIPGIIAVLLLVAGIAYNLGVSAQPRIQINGELDSSDSAQHQEYERIVASAFAKLPTTARTKLTFDSEALAVQLQKNHPELGGVRISLPFFGQRPIVHLETPPRSFVYSNGRVSSAILDSSGRVLSLGGSSDLPRVIDTSALEVEVGKQVLPSDEAAFMRLAFNEFKQAGVTVESFNLPPVVGRLELRLQGAPYFVRMTTQHPPAEQIGAYLATRASLVEKGITPAEYVDVRVSGRIYYK